jgi:hypothetical protein
MSNKNNYQESDQPDGVFLKGVMYGAVISIFILIIAKALSLILSLNIFASLGISVLAIFLIALFFEIFRKRC